MRGIRTWAPVLLDHFLKTFLSGVDARGSRSTSIVAGGDLVSQYCVKIREGDDDSKTSVT